MSDEPDFDDYDLPIDSDYFSVENGTYDNTNSIGYHLAKYLDSDIWVAYSTWQSPDGGEYSVKGIGRLSLDPVELNRERMHEEYREKLESLNEDYERDDLETVPVTDERIEKDIDTLVRGWEEGVDVIVGDAVYEGLSAVDNLTLSVLSQEPFYHEAQEIKRNHDRELTPDEFDIAQETLASEATRNQTRNSTHNEYFARVTFDVEPWELRALELEINGVFHRNAEAAKVYAIREESPGISLTAIGEKLGKDKSTVSRQLKDARDLIERSNWTAETVHDPDDLEPFPRDPAGALDVVGDEFVVEGIDSYREEWGEMRMLVTNRGKVILGDPIGGVPDDPEVLIGERCVIKDHGELRGGEPFQRNLHVHQVE